MLKTWLGDNVNLSSKPRIDALQGYAFIIMYGTAFMFIKEGIVLMFQHLKQSYLRKQSYFLMAAAFVHVVGQLTFYIVRRSSTRWVCCLSLTGTSVSSGRAS